MTYKEKYENLVKAIKEFRDLNCHDEGIRNWVNDNVPELAESDDERIRKTLIEMFSNASKNDWRGIPNEKVIAWLEKQGNQPQGKTALEAINEEKVDNANKVESKFEVGVWIIHQGTGNIYQVTACIDNQYQLKYGDNYTVQKCDEVDRHARLWTIKDAKPGDVLVDVYGNIGIYEKCDDFDWTSYCSLGCNGGFQNFEVEHENDKTHPATKEQWDIIFAEMKERGYALDTELKVLI